jgi:hypothetical protein
MMAFPFLGEGGQNIDMNLKDEGAFTAKGA